MCPSSYFCFIPFHLSDPAGILFFGHVFSLTHQAFEHFVIHQLECSWAFWFQNPEWIVPIKQAHAQYFQPLRAGQECQIQLALSTLSTCSFTLTSDFIQDREMACSVETIHVFCDRATRAKIPIPPLLLTPLQNYSHRLDLGLKQLK
jgi:1,4-dihydroxy-2-naphthoyl-CoA hydrolase